jgi:hypothetical protein
MDYLLEQSKKHRQCEYLPHIPFCLFFEGQTFPALKVTTPLLIRHHQSL